MKRVWATVWLLIGVAGFLVGDHLMFATGVICSTVWVAS